MPISVPLNPIAAHLGQGVIQVYAEFPVEGDFKEFEVESAYNLAGPYYQFSNNRFTTKDGFLYNFPLGPSTYLRIRSVDINGLTSDWVQVRLGVISKPIVTMLCRAIRGSQIPQNSLFTNPKVPHRIVGFLALEDINFTD